MNATTVQLAAGILIAIIGSGALSAVITKRIPAVETDAERLARAESRIDRLEKRIAHVERIDRLKDDYIAELRQHISDGKAPPPPPWPPELIA